MASVLESAMVGRVKDVMTGWKTRNRWKIDGKVDDSWNDGVGELLLM